MDRTFAEKGSRSCQDEYVMTRREALELITMAGLATLLAACGRKGPLTPPQSVDPDDPDEYELEPDEYGF